MANRLYWGSPNRVPVGWHSAFMVSPSCETQTRWSPFPEMRSRWKTASEICQLYAAVRALDDSQSVNEGGLYDFSKPPMYLYLNHRLTVLDSTKRDLGIDPTG